MRPLATGHSPDPPPEVLPSVTRKSAIFLRVGKTILNIVNSAKPKRHRHFSLHHNVTANAAELSGDEEKTETLRSC